jgi:hypothetical protein
MCQHGVLNDGLDYSQKGKSPFTRSVIRCLQDRSVVHYMDSWIDIVTYVYIKTLQKIQIFYKHSVQ